jgi:hypothetical protein
LENCRKTKFEFWACRYRHVCPCHRGELSLLAVAGQFFGRALPKRGSSTNGVRGNACCMRHSIGRRTVRASVTVAGHGACGASAREAGDVPMSRILLVDSEPDAIERRCGLPSNRKGTTR